MTTRKRTTTNADTPPTTADAPARKGRGGARPGAGRKPNPEPRVAPGELTCDPAEHFARILLDPRQPAARRDAAAATLLKAGWRVPDEIADRLDDVDRSWMRPVAKLIGVKGDTADDPPPSPAIDA